MIKEILFSFSEEIMIYIYLLFKLAIKIGVITGRRRKLLN